MDYRDTPRGAKGWYANKYAITDGVTSTWVRKMYYLNYMSGASAVFQEEGLANHFVSTIALSTVTLHLLCGVSFCCRVLTQPCARTHTYVVAVDDARAWPASSGAFSLRAGNGGFPCVCGKLA